MQKYQKQPPNWAAFLTLKRMFICFNSVQNRREIMDKIIRFIFDLLNFVF